MTYDPIPDSVAGRAVAYLRSIYPQRVTSFELGKAIGVDGSQGMFATLRFAVRAGAILVDKSKPKRVRWSASEAATEDPDELGPRIERGYGTDAPGRELAEVWRA